MTSLATGPSLSSVNSDADEDDDVINETDTPAPTALMPGAVKAYYNDQSKLKAEMKMAYIILQMADMENRDLAAKHKEEAAASDEATKAPPLYVPRSFVEATEPFATLNSQKGKKSKKVSSLVLPKKEIAKEIVRRCPATPGRKGVNHNNKSVEQLMALLLKNPITDSSDISFIKAEFQTHSSVIEQLLEDGKTKRVVADKIARLRFIVILCTNDDVKSTYLRSTDGKTAQDIDYEKTDKAAVTWMDLLCELFNDPDQEYFTQIIMGLHEDFQEPIDCSTEYVLTVDGCKQIMSTMKTKLRKIIHAYMLSGNGSDMAKFDGDTDDEADDEEANEDGGTEAEYYGHFNRERSIRRAERREITLIDGDDRGSFLRGDSVDLLYWWAMLDEIDLLHFFMGKLSEDLSSSSNKTPNETSRKNKDSSGSTTAANKKHKQESDALKQQMVDEVKNVGNSLATIAATDIQSQIDRYKDQIANLEEKKIVTESASEALIELWDKRIEEKRNSIKALEDKLHSLESRPKALNYDNAAS
jgi:hypothetical protein